MRFKYGIIDILWGALSAMDASQDACKESAPVLRLKREMLNAIAELNAAQAERSKTERGAKPELIYSKPGDEPEDVA